MKRVILFLSIFIVVIGLAVNAQIIQMQVQIYPQQVLANAPFKVFASAYAISGESVSYISATFDGTSAEATGSTASFEFTAPSITQSTQNFPIVITARTQNGEVFDKKLTVTVSINANPVIEIGKPIPSKNSYIGNVPYVKVPVKVYGGLGLDKIEFMLDTNVASVVNVSPSSTVCFSRTFTVNITHLKNGWHIFSVKAVNIAGEIFSSIAGYVVSTVPPELNFIDMKTYVPANSNVPINITAVSTVSGIAQVTINGAKAKLLYDSTWGATILTPSETGPFEIVAKAEDAAGNVSSASFKSFSDGMYPQISISTSASLVRKGVNWGKYFLPSFTFTATTACSQIMPKVSVSVPNGAYEKSQSIINGYNAENEKVNFERPGTYDVKVAATDPVNGLTTVFSTALSVNFYQYLPQILKVSYSKDVGPKSLFDVSVIATDSTGVGVERVLVNDQKATGIKDDLWSENLLSGNPTKSGYENFNVRVFDYLGNEISSTYNYFVDVNPPYVSITPVASLYINGTYWNTHTPIVINISATTDSKTLPNTKVIINEDPHIYTGNNFISVNLNIPGTYKITVVSTDEINGFSATASKAFKIAFDTIPPEIKKITYPATLAPNTVFNVKAEINDEWGPGVDNVAINGVKAVKISTVTWLATLTSANASSGYESIKVKAEDRLGLSSSVDKKYFIDSQPPIVKIIPVASLFMNNTYWSLSAPAYVEISGNTDSGILPKTEASINGKKTLIYLGKVEIPVNKTGTYNVNVVSTNTVNNLKTDISKSFNFAFDTADPQITNITYPATLGPNAAFRVKVVTFDGTGIGIKEVSVDGLKALKTNNSTWYATVTSMNLSQSGTANFNVTATDYLGKTSKIVKSYFVDSYPPNVEVYLNEKKIEDGSELYAFEKATPTILIKGTTSGMVKPYFEIALNGKKINEQSFNISGINNLNILAVDPVNHKTADFNAKFAICVDPHAPQLTLSAPATVDMISDAKFTVEIQGNDLRFGTLSADIDDMPLYFNTFSSTGSYTLTLRRALAKINGKYVTITLKAADMAGNVSEQKDLIYVDTVGPSIKNVKFSKKILTIYFDKIVEGNANVSVENLNGNLFHLGIGMIDGSTITIKNVELPYGPYKIIVNGITDSSGNVLMDNGSIWEF